eukprot:Platyproteum_vivax@DN7046_c0_g1_i3.p1
MAPSAAAVYHTPSHATHHPNKAWTMWQPSLPFPHASMFGWYARGPYTVSPQALYGQAYNPNMSPFLPPVGEDHRRFISSNENQEVPTGRNRSQSEHYALNDPIAPVFQPAPYDSLRAVPSSVHSYGNRQPHQTTTFRQGYR